MQGKHAIFAGLAAGILFAVTLFAHGAVAQDENYRFYVAGPTSTTPGNLPPCPALNGGLCIRSLTAPAITTLHGDGTVSPRPLSAVVVTSCGLAVALYIQLDATHLLRADPRQSDMFTAVNGEQRQDSAGPMKWEDAYRLAQSAVLTSHVLLPCTDGSQA